MDFALKSDIGKLRQLNEDYYGCYFQENNNLSIFVLGDGMGGHNAGEVASKITVESILSSISEFANIKNKRITEKIIKELSQEAITKANDSVLNLARHNPDMEGMGTTVVMAILWGNKACIAHVGDSRAYMVSNKEITQLTQDHSYIEELIKKGSITREQAQTHPDRNMINRAIGVEEVVVVDTKIVKVEESDAIILCSDGLTNLINEEEILNIFLKGKSSEDICEELVKEANRRGGHDNITAITIIKTT